MKVIDKIKSLSEDQNKVVFSFEFFPPKTDDGVENLFERMDRMVAHNPSFCDITWGAGGTTADLTLDIAKRMQNMICVETMMHLTCTNMPVEKIDHALETIKSNGIQNVLALRGDPPHGQDKFVQVEGGFACALDLVKHMRSKYGDYFGITVAGYPEAHPDVIEENGLATPESYQKDLEYLKQKVDAGADLIVTQLFYDTDIFLKFVNDCRQIGIKCPIVPGIMPINNYKGFLRMTGFCKTKLLHYFKDVSPRWESKSPPKSPSNARPSELSDAGLEEELSNLLLKSTFQPKLKFLKNSGHVSYRTIWRKERSVSNRHQSWGRYTIM